MYVYIYMEDFNKTQKNLSFFIRIISFLLNCKVIRLVTPACHSCNNLKIDGLVKPKEEHLSSRLNRKNTSEVEHK